MDPLTAMALANGLISLLEQVIPIVEAKVGTGEITVTDQKALADRFAALVKLGPQAFQGAEWTPGL